MAGMSEDSARATLSTVVATSDPDDVRAVIRGEGGAVGRTTRSQIERVTEALGQERALDLVDQFAQRSEQMGSLQPEVTESAQQATIGTTTGDDDGEGFERRSERSRQRRERQRGTEREEGQMSLETSAGTRRLTEFEPEETRGGPFRDVSIVDRPDGWHRREELERGTGDPEAVIVWSSSPDGLDVPALVVEDTGAAMGNRFAVRQLRLGDQPDPVDDPRHSSILSRHGAAGDAVAVAVERMKATPPAEIEATLPDPEPEDVDDDGGPDKPAPSDVAERMREAFEDRAEGPDQCNDVVDGLAAAAEVLAEGAPSPFEERDAGAVQAAISDLRSDAVSRFDDLGCFEPGGAHTFTNRFAELADDVTFRSEAAEEAAADVVENYEQQDVAPYRTFGMIADMIRELEIPDADPDPRACQEIYRFLQTDVEQILRDFPRAEDLMMTQQRGSRSVVKGAWDHFQGRLTDALEGNACLQGDPDFSIDDVDAVLRDVGHALLRPAGDVEEQRERFHRFVNNLRTPPAERVGKQTMVPGEEASDPSDVPAPVTRSQVELIVAPDRDDLVTGQGVIVVTTDGRLERRRGKHTGHGAGPIPEGVADAAKEIVRGVVDVDRLVTSTLPEMFPVKVASFYPVEEANALHNVNLNQGVPILESVAQVDDVDGPEDLAPPDRLGIANADTAPDPGAGRGQLSISALTDRYGPGPILAAARAGEQGPLSEREFEFVREQADAEGARVAIPIEAKAPEADFRNVAEVRLAADLPASVGRFDARYHLKQAVNIDDFDDSRLIEALGDEYERVGRLLIDLGTGEAIGADPDQDLVDAVAGGLGTFGDTGDDDDGAAAGAGDDDDGKAFGPTMGGERLQGQTDLTGEFAGEEAGGPGPREELQRIDRPEEVAGWEFDEQATKELNGRKGTIVYRGEDLEAGAFEVIRIFTLGGRGADFSVDVMPYEYGASPGRFAAQIETIEETDSAGEAWDAASEYMRDNPVEGADVDELDPDRPTWRIAADALMRAADRLDEHDDEIRGSREETHRIAFTAASKEVEEAWPTGEQFEMVEDRFSSPINRVAYTEGLTGSLAAEELRKAAREIDGDVDERREWGTAGDVDVDAPAQEGGGGPDLPMDEFQAAIDALSEASDGYGDRIEIDADMARQLDERGLEPSVWDEKVSQDVVRYGIDAEDALASLRDGVEADDPDGNVGDYVAAVIDYARDLDGGETVLVDASGTQVELPMSGEGWRWEQPSDDPTAGVGQGPTTRARWTRQNGDVLAVQGRRTNARVFYWPGGRRDERETLAGPIGLVEALNRAAAYVTGERDLP